MQKFHLSLLLVICTTSFKAQEIQWQKDIITTTQDFLSGLTVTIDEQFLATGSSILVSKISSVSSTKGGKQNNGYDYHLIKLNQNGEEVWEKFFTGTNHDFLINTVTTQEGGFLLAGTTFSPQGLDKKCRSFGGSDIWLIKVAENGNEEWQRCIGTSGNEEARAVVQSTDLGYFLAGSIEDKTTYFGAKDVWLLKLDQQGKPTKEIIIGGKGSDEIEKMIPTVDGGALIGIYSTSGYFSENQNSKSIVQSKNYTVQSANKDYSMEMENTDYSDVSNYRNNPRKEAFFTSESDQLDTQTNSANIAKSNDRESRTSIPVTRNFYAKDTENYGEGDFWIIKLDKDGNIEWQKNYGGKEDDHLRTMALNGDGFIIGGESRSENSGNKSSSLVEGTDVWIISLDKNGNELFQKTYSFGNRDVLMSLNTIWGKPNTKGLPDAKGFLLGGYTQAEGKLEKDDETFWMMYINHQGDEIWRKHIDGKSRLNEERLVSAQMLKDGTYILAGTSAVELGKENWKIVKFGDKQVQDLIEKQDIRIYPNPVEDYCYVEIGFDFKAATIELYDMSGRLQQSLKSQNRITKINTQPLIQGAYLVVVKTETKNTNSKLIKK